jgi:WXG100 family type VII secretion target
MENDSSLQYKIDDIYNRPVEQSTGTSTSSEANISTSIEAIMQHKVRIDASANSLDTLWRAIGAQISAIKTSWVGPDAEAYIQKVYKLDPKVDAAVQALRQISRTYKQAMDEYENTQKEIRERIENQ